ncbi:unnamed protein product [Trifolium pratense]|uniref:Uncharacterized protein n=1 Tax=Trifolium pratense TaxID=57577 RepID=A0ACB0MF59_TRIPR|nr:unnamed protein product [Trifolium pratense]
MFYYAVSTRLSRTILGPQQEHITMVLQEFNISVNCTIRCSARNINERYISNEWFAVVNNANIQAGSRLRSTVSDPPEFLNVVIIDQPQ